MWPILIGLVSFVFSSQLLAFFFPIRNIDLNPSVLGLTLRSFYLRRIQFNQILSSNSAINPSRYLRLMLLALIDIMCTIPLGIYIIYIDLKGIPLAPWISWDDTHFDFGRVVLVPAVIWRSNPVDNAAIQINRWLPIICAFVFFMIFGFAEEAMKNYRRAFWFLARPLGFRPSSEGGSRNGKGKGNILAGYVFLYLFVALQLIRPPIQTKQIQTQLRRRRFASCLCSIGRSRYSFRSGKSQEEFYRSRFPLDHLLS